MNELFTDLESAFTDKSVYTISDKVNCALDSLPDISICAIGGFPISIKNDVVYLLDRVIDKEFITKQIEMSLGLSGILTYANKSNLSLLDMGKKCKELGHFWGYNFMTLTFLFSNQEKEVEKSFLRNKTFFESWVIGNGDIFAMTGSIKDFKKFISNKDDLSFDIHTRRAMNIINNKFNFLWI